jgi:hypothetical protein
MPKEAQESSGFRTGDVLKVDAQRGRVVITLADDPVDRYAGAFNDLFEPDWLEKLRGEWPA